MGRLAQTLIISTLALGRFAVFVSAKRKKEKNPTPWVCLKNTGYLHKRRMQFEHPPHEHTPADQPHRQMLGPQPPARSRALQTSTGTGMLTQLCADQGNQRLLRCTNFQLRRPAHTRVINNQVLCLHGPLVRATPSASVGQSLPSAKAVQRRWDAIPRLAALTDVSRRHAHEVC